MAKNRKHQSAAIRFGPAVKAFLLCLLIGGSGVGYVWQKNQIDQLGREIRALEERRKRLAKQNSELESQKNLMRSPQYLEARAKDLKLGLVAPQPSAVWRLNEPAAIHIVNGRQYAAQESGTALP
jgi:uncharacterized protein HemX